MVSIKTASLLLLSACIATEWSTAVALSPQVDAAVHRTLRQQGTVNLTVTLRGSTKAVLANVQEVEFATRGDRITSLVDRLEQHAQTSQTELNNLGSVECALDGSYGDVAWEAFYRALSGLLSSHDGPILCGGDFNCTLNQMADRSHNNHNKVHDSRELKKLLQKLNLVGTLEDDALRTTDTRDVKAFHRQHHTYYYTLPSGGSASSRLDRWYCSNDHLDWVRSVYQSVVGPFSDHNGVTIRVAAPDKVIQSKKPRVVYPLPKNAAAHAAIIGKDFFEKVHDQLDELRGRYSSPRDYALATANWWDEAKIALRIRYLEAKKSYFARLNQGYKKKIQRLQRRLSESEAQMLGHSGGAVGDHNVELSQEFLTTATSIRRAIAECKSKWQASKRDRIFREHMHHERKTSKSFYKRISTKFLDNTIFALGGTATYGPMRSRELADDMGEGWKSIMQQAPTLQTDIDQILDPGTAIPPSDRLGFLLKPIDSSEIKQAVKKCKRGKAHGPDELGNDWYRDHCDEITGLFERLFNLWIPECVLPRRAIPTTIDVLLAAQQRATSDPAMSRAIALLLDFAKAYDSLDRSFLAQALQHLGFPLKFVHLVKVLHSQTTYKFIVNGFLSRKYNVTSGIRQGCPLAPLLFILALEVLYRKIEESDEIHGVELQAAGCATEVRLGGYADDTTIYLSDPKDINAVFAILDKYGAASGLRVNRHKSAVLPLNKEYSSTEESVSDIHVLQREEHCRYLGIQVGQTPSNASNWSKCIQALRVRLRLARLKTHSVAQRAAIASAVIIPKVLYVARHSWPSTAIVNQLHDLVKQFVWGSRNGKPAKPWMKEEQAELKKMNGGLSVPNIRTELMTMSATAVSKWAITTSHIDQVIGEILLYNTRASSTYITPLDAIPRRPPQLRDNMWTTGAALCASLHSRPYEPRERDNVRWCYEHFKSTIVQTQWDGDVFQIDLSSKMSDRLPGIIAEGRKLRGTFCAEWLPYMTSTADGWLLDSNGSPHKLAHTSLSVGTAQLGDILRWEWIRPGVLNFIPTCGISRFSRPSIRALERLCATLVSNFPQLLYRPQQTNVLRLYNGQRHYNHEWHLHTSEATLTHVDTTLVKATHTVHSAMDCDIMATRDLNGQKVSFHAHPRFTRIVQLWGGNGRYNTARSFYRQQEKADLSCSNPECSQVVQSSVQHLFWECPKAKLVWNYFYALWAKIGITPGHDPAIWIFSLDLPHTPRRAWTTIKRHIIGHKFSNEHLQDHLYSVAHMLWRYMSASLIHAIWCAHLRRMDSDPIESTAEMAIMMTRLEAGMRNLTRLAEAQAGGSDGHTVAAVLKAYVDCFLSQTDAIPLTPSDTRGVYLLFFDGGSRGNPGPGGTGSIIVRVHKDSHTASLIWAASMAYSRKDTTNNFAEYWGLIHGLREAQRSHFEPFRRLADCIDIRGWYHHYRAFNKMADSAANLAMNTRTSTQVHFPTHRAAFNNLIQDLDNDVMHWLMRSSEDPSASWRLGRSHGCGSSQGLCRLLSQPNRRHPLTPNDTRGVYLLFFDGGSRGNPGPGGTGSIIVRVHKDSHTASLIWTASMAYSRKDTTNNFAEYWGLIHGLREAQRSHFEPLYVIGDSALIISQQRMHRSPRQHRLARLYQTSRRLADCIDIRGWYHHYRAFNKMADSAANLAMDTRASTQVHFPTQRAAFNNLTQDLDNDVMHWLMRSSEDPRRMDIVGHDDEPKYTSPYKELNNLLRQESGAAEQLFKRSTSFWISNQVRFEAATFELVEKVSALSSVADVREERVYSIGFPTVPASNNTESLSISSSIDVWAAGFTGQNIVVGSIDTGVLATHNALKSNYRATYGWYDPGTGSTKPYDSSGHGTHTIGSMVGSGGIGVAPGAQWIACKATDTKGKLTDAAVLSCTQFMTCPTDASGNNRDCDSFFQVSVNAWLTAGIIPVFSLGNGGPACRTVSSPGDYTTVIGVGSTDSVDALSSFSSKGPSVGGILKPDISAPGESIRSAWYTGTNVYNTISGTSMAAPHVAGVVTLLLSAFPALSFAQVKSALIGTTDTSSLKSSGMTCGTTPDGKIPNSQHGYGRVNARAALNRVTGVTPAPTPAPAPKPPVTDRCAGLNELLCGEYLCDWNAATASCRPFM
ncbi:reverse transcriptase, partial [Globisporangium splendens]